MVLYTPRSAVRRVDGSDEPDLTRELVLVIPANARVAISSGSTPKGIKGPGKKDTQRY